jgi:hypothetical protein
VQKRLESKISGGFLNKFELVAVLNCRKSASGFRGGQKLPETIFFFTEMALVSAKTRHKRQFFFAFFL